MTLDKEMSRIFPKNLCQGNGTTLGKELFFFKKKSLPRASTQALGKEILFFCRVKQFCRVMRLKFQKIENPSVRCRMKIIFICKL